MKIKTTIILCVFLCFATLFGNAQPGYLMFREPQIILQDTIGDFVFDALVTEMDTVRQENTRLVKYFKYIGSDAVKINKAWTSDPHLICQYPNNQTLKTDSIYSFTVCFTHRGRPGNFQTTMGFDFSNEQRVAMTFKGVVKPEYYNYPLKKIIAPIAALSSCECEQRALILELEKGLMTLEQIKDATNWQAWGKELACEKILFSDFRFTADNRWNNAFYSFWTIALQPLRIIHSDFTINLTPCIVSNTGVRTTISKRYGDIIASFQTSQIGIELSTDIIQNWSNTKKKNKKPQFATILANTMEVMYSNSDNLRIYIDNICPSIYEISGSNMLFSFSNARFESSLSPYSDKYVVIYDMGKQFVLEKNANYPDYSGFQIDSATFQIPYKKKQIVAEGCRILLNNHIITGDIKFQIGRKEGLKTYIITNTDKGEIIEIPVETIKKVFLSFQEFKIDFQENRDFLIVEFTKYLGSGEK